MIGGKSAQLYCLVDEVSELNYGIQEFNNHESAIRAMKMLKFPPYSEKGDFKLYYVGTRVDFDIAGRREPVMIWEYDINQTEKKDTPGLTHAEARNV